MLNQKQIEMLWCAAEQQLHEFGEGKATDPRYKVNDWINLLATLEQGLEELNAGIPKSLVKKKV